MTSRLSGALTPEEVASVIVRQAGPAVGAAECVIYLLESPGVLRFAQVVGMPQVDFEPWRTIPVEAPVPLAQAARLGEPVWLESLEALRAHYPALDGVPLSHQRAWACLPLEVQGRVLGVLTLGFEREQGFAAEDQDFACLVARHCAQALERAQLYEQQRRIAESLQRSLLCLVLAAIVAGAAPFFGGESATLQLRPSQPMPLLGWALWLILIACTLYTLKLFRQRLLATPQRDRPAGCALTGLLHRRLGQRGSRRTPLRPTAPAPISEP